MRFVSARLPGRAAHRGCFQWFSGPGDPLDVDPVVQDVLGEARGAADAQRNRRAAARAASVLLAGALLDALASNLFDTARRLIVLARCEPALLDHLHLAILAQRLAVLLE